MRKPTYKDDPFADAASSYESWFVSPLGAFVDHREREALECILEGKDVELILEIGAGTGHISRHLVEYCRRVIAVEPSQAMRRQGKLSTAGLSVRWCAARCEQLPFVDGCFDAAIFFTTLEFVDEPEKALHEAFRVVRTGGWVVVAFLHAWSPWAALYRYRGHQGMMPWAAARFFIREDLERLTGTPVQAVETAVYLAPHAAAPYEEADRAGKRAGNVPAMEIVRWRKQE